MRWTRQRRRVRCGRRAILIVSGHGAQTNGAEAYGEVVWSWHPLLMLSLAEARSAQPGVGCAIQFVRRRWQKEFVTGESAKETVKTIAWGMPDVSGASAVNTGVHTHYPQRTPGCGCIGHPAFPAPSVFKGRNEFAKLGRSARREMRSHVGKKKLAVIVRLDRTIQYSEASMIHQREPGVLDARFRGA
jgi:hypothetical protein